MKSLILTTVFLLSFTAFSQSIVLNNLYPDEITSAGFSLSENSTVKIEGSGAVFYEDWRAIVYYGWIIDSKSREVVWHLFDVLKDSDLKDANGQLDFNLNVDLNKGAYEAYFAAAYNNGNDWNGWGHNWSISSFDDVVKRILSSRDRQKFRGSYAEDFYFKVSSNNLRAVDLKELLDEKISSSIVSFNRVEDSESRRKGFSLSADTKVRIYAIGEAKRNESYDYFWIYDAQTREPVFKMDYDNTDFAGGADKNQKFDGVITLKKGDYIASYVTDGSHSYEKWNALPPDDPQFWGVTIWPASESDRQNIIAYKEPKTAAPILELTRARDDEMLSSGLSIKKEMDMRVLCLGEEGSDSMVDYGWIINANTRGKVWKMKASRSEHAGGAKKNRKVSQIVTLPAGEYIVYYSTDGSHSYRDWNSARPHEEEMWGITLWATDEDDLKYASVFEPSAFVNKNALTQILRVRDDEYIKESFTLDEDADVRILALGEGSSGEMYDYGTIKDESGRTIWRMDYYDSDYAGGASKNREFNEKISLKKGTYQVTYRTDGSHSYARWNASPPNNEEMYGILILKE